jgi:hypothetical protein
VISDEAAPVARRRSKCRDGPLLRDRHARLFGGLRTIGLNTGLITSRLAMHLPE